ncbi:hypothetical protein K474DRAFT_450118 [Panus rudis PR-1116 ss-1]|nr:hypothetical protein K474DRAFT_450118 [Panus rudis PR-1116 ss-1]
MSHGYSTGFGGNGGWGNSPEPSLRGWPTEPNTDGWADEGAVGSDGWGASGNRRNRGGGGGTRQRAPTPWPLSPSGQADAAAASQWGGWGGHGGAGGGTPASPHQWPTANTQNTVMPTMMTGAPIYGPLPMGAVPLGPWMPVAGVGGVAGPSPAMLGIPALPTHGTYPGTPSHHHAQPHHQQEHSRSQSQSRRHREQYQPPTDEEDDVDWVDVGTERPNWAWPREGFPTPMGGTAPRPLSRAPSRMGGPGAMGPSTSLSRSNSSANTSRSSQSHSPYRSALMLHPTHANGNADRSRSFSDSMREREKRPPREWRTDFSMMRAAGLGSPFTALLPKRSESNVRRLHPTSNLI